MRLLFTLFVATLMASCASTNSVPSDFRFGPATAQALIVGSITYDSAIGLYGVEATARGGGPAFVANVGYSQWPPLGPEFDKALNKKGGTFAVAVAPGQYTLQRWTTLQGQRTYAPPQPLGIPFRADAGRATYLGNFHFDRDGNVTLADRADRDLPILRNRFPAAGIATPAYAIRSGARIENLGSEAASRADATLYAANSVAAPSSLASRAAVTTFDPLTMASVQDTADSNGSGPGGTRFFVLAEVDGKPVSGNAQSASMRASRGMGPNMRVVDVERAVPARKTRLKLRGSIGHAAPIQAIFAAIASGGSREVVGEIDVDLKPDGRYRVNGVIDELRSEVWLEDADTRQIVSGSRIAAAPTAEALKAAAAPAMFTCCNLHHDTDRWISDANWIEQPFVPAGTPVRVYDYKSDRAKVVIDGKVAWLGLDYGRKQQTLTQLVSRLAVRDDPTERIRTYPAEVQAAIRAGKVSLGMTKEQVIVALGYPRTDLTPSTAALRWSYLGESDAPFVFVWSAEGELRAVEAAPALRALVVQGP